MTEIAKIAEIAEIEKSNLKMPLSNKQGHRDRLFLTVKVFFQWRPDRPTPAHCQLHWAYLLCYFFH